MTQAFMNLLQGAPEPRIVNVSTSLASLTLQCDPTWDFYNVKVPAYTSSKEAVNMYTINLAYELRDTELKVNVVDPGWTNSEFTDHQGTGTLEKAAARIIKYATIDENGPSGRFFSVEYNPETEKIPW